MGEVIGVATTELVPRLRQKYESEIRPEIAKKCGRTNPFALPRLNKVVVSMGFGRATTQGEKNRLDEVTKHLAQITGQKAAVTVAKKSVAGFRLREGMKIGAKVTLRGDRMYEFLDRLMTVALPRVRDFRGVSMKAFDGHGNYSLGITDQTIFPEVDADKLQHTQGMNITIVINQASDEESLELLKMMGMPFRTPSST